MIDSIANYNETKLSIKKLHKNKKFFLIILFICNINTKKAAYAIKSSPFKISIYGNFSELSISR